MNSKQEDLFSSEASGKPPITLKLSLIGRGPVPSLKNSKRSFAWIDTKNHPPETMVHHGKIWLNKRTIRLMARPMTEQRVKDWMESAIHSLQCQLLSALAITESTIRTVAQPRSLIASCTPLNDSWTWIRDLRVKSELCEKGQEGATIEITRIS